MYNSVAKDCLNLISGDDAAHGCMLEHDVRLQSRAQ